MFEKPEMASGKDPKKPKKEKPKKESPTVVEIPALPQPEKLPEGMSVAELDQVIKEYDAVISDMMKKNRGSWNFIRQ